MAMNQKQSHYDNTKCQKTWSQKINRWRINNLPTGRPPQAGFTLLEVVIVMLVLSIIAGLTAPIFSQGLAATHTTAENLQTIEKLRYASERLAREIRQVNYNGAGYDITTMVSGNCPVSANCLVFTKNDTTTTTVTIGLTGNAMTLGYSTPALSATLTDEVSRLAFAYYDVSNAVTASAANVAYIEYTLTLQNPDTGGSFSQRTRVALREQS